VASLPDNREQAIVQKIRALPEQRLEELEDFIDSLAQRKGESPLSGAMMRLSEEAFAGVWDNPADAEYDRI
jgi:hypothetical protein